MSTGTESSQRGRMDECFCCEDPFLETQLDDDGLCTMCVDARRSFALDGMPGGRPCCRKALTELRKKIIEGRA